MNDPILHVYGQHANHSELIISGNKEALLALSHILKYAIESGEGVNVMNKFRQNDGEFYPVEIHCLDDEQVEKLEPAYQNIAAK